MKFTFTFYLYSVSSGMVTVCHIPCVYRHQSVLLVVSEANVLAASEHGLLLKEFNLLLNRAFQFVRGSHVNELHGTCASCGNCNLQSQKQMRKVTVHRQLAAVCFARQAEHRTVASDHKSLKLLNWVNFESVTSTNTTLQYVSRYFTARLCW